MDVRNENRNSLGLVGSLIPSPAAFAAAGLSSARRAREGRVAGMGRGAFGRWVVLVLTGLVLVGGLGSPSTVEAGAWAGAVRNAIAKRSVAAPQTQAMAFGKHAYGKPHDVIIHRSRHPQAAAHIEHAQRRGQPSVLHIGREGAGQRRAAAIGSVSSQRKPGRRFDRDEYPPAFTREGAGNASVRWIHQSDNRGAGASMAAQTRHLPDGSKIRVLVR